MVKQQSVQLLYFKFGSRTFAYQRLAHGLNSSAFTSVIRETLDPVVKADWCAQYVDDISVAAQTASELIYNFNRVFKQLQKAGVKLTCENCQFGKLSI